MDTLRVGYRPMQAAAATGLSRALLYEEMARGKLPYAQVRGVRVILADDLRTWLQSYKAGEAVRDA